ncbi:MAG: transporter substrate-binding domain-containing protein [Woeseiaceae bacterium]|jgi:membrane-bound lytic murein transglycosylase MltF|nr:transporter substrate-binding domain-containing protein [Woeseiaceae bacterium]
MIRLLPVIIVLSVTLLAACGGGNDGPDAGEPADAGAPAEMDSAAEPADPLPTDTNFTIPFEQLWQPWIGDLPGMVERRVIRVVVPYGGYQFYYDAGAPKGAVYDLLKQFESYLNQELGRKNIRVYVAVIPLSRDQLFPALLNGNADLIAADITETERRGNLADFTSPLLTDIDEIIVTGPKAPKLESLDDLSGRDVFVRASSSYHEHLLQVVDDFIARGVEPPNIVLADELLETHDILEMLDAGLVDITVVDDYKADFWTTVYENITLHRDLAVHRDGQTSWAFRKESPEFADMLAGFMRRYGKGTLVGNDTYSRYLADAERVRCTATVLNSERLTELETAFRTSAEEFDFDWLMLAAQAFQESRFRHGRKSPAGAVGVMQIKPSTAADRNVGIADISSVSNNVRAGAKYMRFLIERYFSDDDIDELNGWFFGLAAYNAGPARVARLRREAASEGKDPNLWFDNVEIIAGRHIGRETVSYVSSVYKYFIGYHLMEERALAMQREFPAIIGGC